MPERPSLLRPAHHGGSAFEQIPQLSIAGFIGDPRDSASEILRE
jgi:hypothetical protein